MAILSSLPVPSPPKFQVKRCQPCQFHGCSEIYLPRQAFYNQTTSIKTSIKSSVADNNEPNSTNEVKMQIGIMKDKLREAVPISVQEFPWRKSQHILIDRLLLFMQEALKWSVIIYFIFSSLSDVLYTIAINQELIIPVGLFVGCLLADFLEELSQELFHHSEEQELKLRSLGLCCIFVFVKFMSTWFASPPGVFLLHVANGGLMQVLWYYWRNFMKDSQNRQEKSTG